MQPCYFSKCNFSKEPPSIKWTFTSTKKPKPEKNEKSDVALFIVNNNIKDKLQLMVAITERRDLGDRSHYNLHVTSFLFLFCFSTLIETQIFCLPISSVIS